MGRIVTRGFIASDETNTNTLSRKIKASSDVQGRVDLYKEWDGFELCGTLSDYSFRNYEAAPWLPDLLVTAGKKVSSKVYFGTGFDFGLQSILGHAKVDTNFDNRGLHLGGWWFQKGNEARIEGRFNPDAFSSLWAAWTADENMFRQAKEGATHLAHGTFINLKQREGFIIPPFTVPVASKAAKYSYKRNKYTIEGSWDFGRNAPFLEVSGRPSVWDNFTLKGSVAFKDKVGLVEVDYDTPNQNQLPVAKGYVKVPYGGSGGRPGFGFILKKEFTW